MNKALDQQFSFNAPKNLDFTGSYCIFKKDSSSDGYLIMAPHEGYFYIAADNRIYPSEVTQGLKSTSGMFLDKFKQDVKSYAQN